MNRVAKWLDNYWYHYKWHTIVTIFVVLVMTVVIGQYVTRDEVDVYMMYAGPAALGSGVVDVEYAFEQFMDDYTGDGHVNAQLFELTMLSDEQIAEEKKKASADRDFLVIDANAMKDQRTRFSTEIMAGESVICLLDPAWFAQVKDVGGLAKLSDAVGEKPAAAFDDYGIYLKDTDFGKYFSVFQNLPDDTVLCVRGMTLASTFKGQSEEESRYQYHYGVVKSVLSFTLPEGFIPPETNE